MNSASRRLCLIPHYTGVGGPSSFQRRLAGELTAGGVQVTFELADHPYDAVLVVGATRRLGSLWRIQQAGIPIYQRLNGMNWIHRQRRTGWRHFLRAEAANRLLVRTRNHLATGVIYQSRFAQEWWERVYGPAPGISSVILNGVDLDRFSPDGPEKTPEDRVRILVVEGRLAGGYELGLEHALALARALGTRHSVELLVAGQVDQRLRARWDENAGLPIRWLGIVPVDEIPALDRSAHLLHSVDIHPACPNTVVEALACGLPVVAFDTGALSELVTPQAGRIVDYGADAWRLERPDFESLAVAAEEIINDQEHLRRGARQRAQAVLSLKSMTDQYLHVFGWD